MSGLKAAGGMTNQCAYMCGMLETDHLQNFAQTCTEYQNIPDTVLMPQIKKETKHSIYPKELRVQREDRSKKNVIDYKRI